jgi:hypothetical protein
MVTVTVVVVSHCVDTEGTKGIDETDNTNTATPLKNGREDITKLTPCLEQGFASFFKNGFFCQADPARRIAWSTGGTAPLLNSAPNLNIRSPVICGL